MVLLESVSKAAPSEAMVLFNQLSFSDKSGPFGSTVQDNRIKAGDEIDFTDAQVFTNEILAPLQQ